MKPKILARVLDFNDVWLKMESDTEKIKCGYLNTCRCLSTVNEKHTTFSYRLYLHSFKSRMTSNLCKHVSGCQASLSISNTDQTHGEACRLKGLLCLPQRQPNNQAKSFAMKFYHFILLLQLQQLSSSETYFPIEIQVQNGFNITAYIGEFTLCEAVKLCHDEGKSILNWDALMAIRSSNEFLNTNSPSGTKLSNLSWWTGLVDALVERNTTRSGWVWIEDGRVTTEAEGGSIFGSKEPDNIRHEDCVAVGSSSAMTGWDENCHARYNALCYTSDNLNGSLDNNRGPAFFDQTAIKAYNQPDPGCYVRIAASKKYTHHLDCAADCIGLSNICVGFYWNSVRRDCILLPFFDASVQLMWNNDEEKLQWTKFLRGRHF